MSDTSTFGPIPSPVPVLTAAEVEVLLNNITLSFAESRKTHGWMSTDSSVKRLLLTEAGMSWERLLQGSGTPDFLVKLTDELAHACARRCIYPCSTAAEFSDNYYFEYIPAMGRIYVKYQQIIGSRLLAKLTEEQSASLRSRLVEKAKTLVDTAEYRLVMARAANVVAQVAAREQAQLAQKYGLADQMEMLKVHGQDVLLPEQHLSEYAAIKRKLETAGARYVASKKKFTFPAGYNASEILGKLQGGSQVNLKKDYQFFASTPPVCEAIRDMLPQRLTGLSGLEPSAGDGVLADLAKSMGAEMTVVELWDVQASALRAKGYSPVERNFLELTPAHLGLFDFIVANPPFSGGRDVEHFMHMTKFLKPGGTLCCVMSQSWQTLQTKKASAFRDFLSAHKAQVEELPAGTFKESGTGVGAAVVRWVAPETTDSVAVPSQEELALA